MSKERQPECQVDKAEEKEENNDKVPMERFKALSRRLLNISNVQLKEELEREAKTKAAQRKRKGT